MRNLRSTLIVTLLINAAAFACSSDSPKNTTGSGGAKAGSGGASGSGGAVTGSGGAVTGSGGTSVGSGGTSGGSGGNSGGSGGGTAGTGGSTSGTGGNSGTGGSKPDASADVAAEKPARACLPALGEAPGGYDWNTCCPYEAATAQDWCTHYAAFCKFNYPISSDLSPGAVALKDMADCLSRFPPLTLKSRACRSNFLCEDSSLGQATAKACDFPDLNRRKCDGL